MMARAEVIDTRQLKQQLLVVIEEAGRLLSELEPYAHRYEGYTLVYTWVLNKVKKRYYYYYLKSKTRHPSSIYVGRSAEADVLHKLRNQELKTIVIRLRKILRLAIELEQLLETMEAAKQLLTWLKELEQEEKKTKKKLQELRAYSR